MVRLACLSAAAVLVAAVDDGCASAVLEDAYAQAWFWGPPSRAKTAAPRQQAPRPNDPAPRQKPPERGPAWFWSFQPADPAKARRDNKRFTYFSGSDVWRQGSFLYGGMLWTPAGLDHDGFVVKLTTSTGRYQYRSGLLGSATTVTGTMYATSIMPGLRFTRGGVTVGLYAGFDYQVHTLSPDDPGNAARGRQTGIRKAIDLWYQPTDLTMIAVSATVSTIGYAHAIRAAFGWRLLDRFYLGPEAVFYGAADYRQFRIGAHVTGLELLWLEWQGGIGYAIDDDGYGGAYLRFGVSDRW